MATETIDLIRSAQNDNEAVVRPYPGPTGSSKHDDGNCNIMAVKTYSPP